jgi:hypothetical protein
MFKWAEWGTRPGRRRIFVAMRIAILDDYQDVALSFADWDSLDA